MLDKFMEWLILNCDEKNTIKTYYHQIRKFLFEYREINQETINMYLKNKINNNTPKNTINQFIKAVKKYCIFSKLNIELPKLKKQDKKLPQYIKYNIIKKDILPNLYFIFEHDYEKRGILIEFMFWTGLRPNEVIELKRKNINLNERIIKIIEPKNDKERLAYFPKSFKNKLIYFFKREPEKENAFNINKNYLRYTFDKINKDLNIHITPKTMRHSFAVHQLLKTGNLKYVKELMGHSDIKTTEIYTQLSNKDINNLYDKYNK